MGGTGVLRREFAAENAEPSPDRLRASGDPNRRPDNRVRCGGLTPLTPLPFRCQPQRSLSYCIHITSICG